MDASPILAVPRVPAWLQRSLIVVGIFSVPGLILATSMYVASGIKGEDLSFAEALLWRAPEWQAWALATPLIVYLGRRFPIWRRPWQSAPIHLVANAAVGVLDIVVYWSCGQLVGQEPFASMPLMDLLPWMLLKTAFFEMLIYWTIIGADHGLAYQRRYREGVLKQAELEARLASTQLEALKMQLHPHFLFNTLHSISALVDKDTRAADKMIARLGDFLRLTLENSGTQEVTLQKELEFLRCYLEIERIRFHDRLTTHLDIDPEALDTQVPNLILQPIVENAIRHGIAPRSAPGRIEIRAERENGTLRIQVRDNGPGMVKIPSDDDPAVKGLGLSNTQARLKQLYGTAHRFELANDPKGGLVVTLEIPSGTGEARHPAAK